MKNISKMVIACDTGRRIGYVLDVAIDFDTMKKRGYYVVDEETESEFLLENSDIKKISENFFFIESARKLQFSFERVLARFKLVLDEFGNNYGYVLSFSFKGQRCEKFVTEKCEIPSKYVTKIGEDVIFVHFGRKKIEKKRDFFEKSAENVVVSIQEAKKQSEQIEIAKVMLSADFYVGKTTTEDIFGYNNEKIVSKGQTITKSIVAKAKQHNKLNQLFFALRRDK